MNVAPSVLVVLGIIILFVILAFIANASSHKKIGGLRARGIYPEEGKEREEDILRLLQAGEKIMAIKVYRTLHGVGLKEAKDAVEDIEKRIPRAN